MLHDMTMDQLESLWSDIKDHFQARQLWINQLGEALGGVERSRVEKVNANVTRQLPCFVENESEL